MSKDCPWLETQYPTYDIINAVFMKTYSSLQGYSILYTEQSKQFFAITFQPAMN